MCPDVPRNKKETMTDTPVTEAPLFTFTLEGDTTALFAALAKAQASYEVAKKTATNPHFKSKFAPLDEVIAATHAGNSANGISVLQPMVSDQFGNMYLMTIVSHESGGCIKSTVPLGEVGSIQDLGSKVTYMRRYARSALLGVAADEDDDGNAGNDSRPQSVRKEPSAPKPAPATDLSKATQEEVIATAKAKGLDGAGLAKVVYEQTGQKWKDCSELDAKKVLAALVLLP